MYYLNIFVVVFFFIFFNSCSQNFQNHGISEKRIKNFDLKIGKTSKQYLINKYGPPTFENVFNNNVIYYVMHNTSYKTFEKRKTDKLLVFEITFDNKNKVLNFKKYTENESFDINISKSEDSTDLDLKRFWKDVVNAMRRKTVED